MDHFIRAWKERFPGTDPPQHLHHCLDSGDLAEYEEALETSYRKISELQKDITYQEFIGSYLRELVKKEKCAPVKSSSKDFSPVDPLDRQVPLLSSTDTLSSGHSYTEVSYDNIDNLSSPENQELPPARQIYANETVLSNNGNFKFESKPPPPKPVPAPRASTTRSFNEPVRSSVFMMQNISKGVDNSQDKKIQRGGSLDSHYTKSAVPSRKAPEPPAKPTQKSIRRFKKQESVDSPEENGSVRSLISSQKKGSNASLSKTSSEESCVEISVSPKPDGPVSPTYDRSSTIMSTFKPQSNVSKPKLSNSSPKLHRRYSPVGENVTAASCLRKNNGKQESEAIYDEPIPVKEDQVEDDASSSDEEPVYLNIMLLKQKHQTMDSRMTYASLDIHKQRLERDAKKLSCRYSLQPSGQSKGFVKHSKVKQPPMMKQLKLNSSMKLVRGVTEEESSTEQGIFFKLKRKHCLIVQFFF